MDDAGDQRLSFLGRRPPTSFEWRMIAIEPGEEGPFDESEWRDALVVVEAGEIELECRSGARTTFLGGDVLCLTGLSLCLLRNRGRAPAVLSAVWRRDAGAPDPSAMGPMSSWAIGDRSR